MQKMRITKGADRKRSMKFGGEWYTFSAKSELSVNLDIKNAKELEEKSKKLFERVVAEVDRDLDRHIDAFKKKHGLS